MTLKLFHIVYKGGRLPILGEKLELDEGIDDYQVISKGDTSIDFHFIEDLADSVNFHLAHKSDVDNYYKEFLIITNSRYKVLGLIRV
jgi:hypothetical protein